MSIQVPPPFVCYAIKPPWNMLHNRNVGPYTGVQHMEHVTKSGRTFIILTYQAYNALGLIGSECNGVAILDEDNKQVLCDEIDKQSTGWCGANDQQIKTFRDLVAMDYADFAAFINNHHRSRYKLELTPPQTTAKMVGNDASSAYKTPSRKAGVKARR